MGGSREPRVHIRTGPRKILGVAAESTSQSRGSQATLLKRRRWKRVFLSVEGDTGAGGWRGSDGCVGWEPSLPAGQDSHQNVSRCRCFRIFGSRCMQLHAPKDRV